MSFAVVGILAVRTRANNEGMYGILYETIHDVPIGTRAASAEPDRARGIFDIQDG